jgi:TIR domain
MAEQAALHLQSGGEHGKDIFLCHTGADKPWVERLAERIEAQPYQTRFLGVVFDKWDFGKGGNIVVDIEREIDSCRFVGVVVTRAMLGAEWPTLERSIAVWADPSGAKGRVIPLLRENVTLPASLRIRNWIDFRDDARFEEAFAELVRVLRGEKTPRGRGSLLPTIPETKLPYDPAPVVITSSVGADRVEERLVSNLMPVVELPQTVFSAETPLRSKADIHEYSDKTSHPAFVLREGRLWTFVNLRKSARAPQSALAFGLADRYAVRMLLHDLISTESGAHIARQIRSMLPQDECILWLLLLSIGSVFFFGPSEPFHLPLVRKRDHPTDLARMNIVMRSIVEWGEAKQRSDIKEWASSTKNFEWVAACIQDAAKSNDRRDDWIAQGEFLRSDAGRDYLDILYKDGGVITQEIVESWWKV